MPRKQVGSVGLRKSSVPVGRRPPLVSVGKRVLHSFKRVVPSQLR